MTKILASSDDVMGVLMSIVTQSSKKSKEAIIREYSADPLFKRVLTAMLDPFVTYGIASIPSNEQSAGTQVFDDSTWALLQDLANRVLTGNAARTAVKDELNRLSLFSGQLLTRILQKSSFAGFSESTVNSAIPGLITTFDCMLAHKFEEERVTRWPQIVEPKLDGVRVLAFIKESANEVRFFSRSGKEFLNFDHIKMDLLDKGRKFRMSLPALSDEFVDSETIVLDGEMVSGSFNKTVSEVRRMDGQAKDAIFHVFDMLYGDCFTHEDKKGSVSVGTYTERRERLTRFMAGFDPRSVEIIRAYTVNSVAEIHSIYAKVRERGLEGLIVKDPNGLYHRRRNHAWMKIKNEETVEVRIVGAEEGINKYQGMLGALVCELKNGVRVNVGSGLSDEQRDTFWRAYRHDVSPQETLILPGRLLGRFIEVEFHEYTPDGSLRHPRFVRFRDDKASF